MKPSHLLAALSWASLFTLVWMILLKFIQSSGMTAAAMILFATLAVISSAVASSDPVKK